MNPAPAPIASTACTNCCPRIRRPPHNGPRFWKRRDGEAALDDRTLRRIIGKLIGLAALAERAAGRCFLIRFLVLLVLRRAEAAARDYVADAMLLDGLWFDDDLGNGSHPLDAERLALRFRELAALLCTLLEDEGPRAPAGTSPDRRTHAHARAAGRPAGSPAATAAWTSPAPDTS